MNIPYNEPLVMTTNIDHEHCWAKLSAQKNPFASVSLFSKRKIHYPQLQVAVQGNQFQLEQRKSYVNPWAPRFHGTIEPAGEFGTIVAGAFVEKPYLNRMVWLYRVLMVGGCLVSAWTLRNLWAGVIIPSWQMVLWVSLVCNVGLIVALAVLKRSCEKSYRALAEGEEEFILESLQQTLQIKGMPELSTAKAAAGPARRERLAA